MRDPNVTSLYFANPLAFNVSDGTVSVKFCTAVKGWPVYKMAKKYCRNFQPPDKQTTDGFAKAKTRTRSGKMVDELPIL